MRDEYDFSDGERGKFFNQNAQHKLPVYLDEEIMAYMEGIAKKRKTDTSSLINQLLRSDIQIIENMR